MITVTATELPRLMACNGSRLMGASEAPVNPDTTVRDEGNAAHWLVEQVHKGDKLVEEYIDRKAPNGVYITAEMVEYLEDYLSTMEGAQIEVETSHGAHTWRINGRADRITYDAENQWLYVPDLKYGWSIVEPEMNWTLISHVLGFMNNNPDKPVKGATLAIYQPRPYHPAGRVRSWSITREQIEQFWTEIATTLSNPTDQLNTGQHCRYCPAFTDCPARRKAQYNAIDATEKAFTDRLDNKELSAQLDHLARAVEVLKEQEKAYKELALHRIKKGQIVNNYTVDTELTNRVWKQGVTPEMMQSLTGQDLTKKQLITPKQVENAGISKEVVAALCERRNKGVKLVRMSADAKASQMFENKGDK